MPKYNLNIEQEIINRAMPDGLKHNIIRGAYYGDLDEVKSAVSEFRDAVHIRDRWSGATALHVAASLGNYSIVEYLLACDGIDPEVQDKNGRDALDRAWLSGHDELITLIAHFVYPHEMPDDNDPSDPGSSPSNITPLRRQP